MNPYDYAIEKFFNRILELRHNSMLVRNALESSVKKFEKNFDVDLIAASSLVLSDWTGPTDKGLEINDYAGPLITTQRASYKLEIDRIISQECCYAFTQSFEALETLFKDFIFVPSLNDQCNQKWEKRADVPGGLRLFALIIKAGNPIFIEYSNKNNKGIKFEDLWSILSEVRHGITHSSSLIKLSKLKKSTSHFKLFQNLFSFTPVDSETILVQQDYGRLTYVLNHVSEFGYQVYKILSEKNNLELRKVSEVGIPPTKEK